MLQPPTHSKSRPAKSALLAADRAAAQPALVLGGFLARRVALPVAVGDALVEQAHELAALVQAEPDLELLAPVATNIVCFRYNPGGLSDEQLNALNEELLIRLHESGIAAPSYTTLHGRYCLRAAIVNYRTTSADLPVLVGAVREIGASLPRP